MEEEKNIHEGHRERLMELAVKAGFENLSAIQKVEVVLCYIFPRGDVNPLAHRLLDRYKNLSTILEAPVEDLQMVKGIGKVAALKLHTLLNIYTDYLNDKMINQYKNATFGEICDYLESLVRFKRTEELHIIGINPKNEIVGDRCLAKGNVRLVAVEMIDIAYFIATYKVSAVLLAHNHPYGSCHPSQ